MGKADRFARLMRFFTQKLKFFCFSFFTCHRMHFNVLGCIFMLKYAHSHDTSLRKRILTLICTISHFSTVFDINIQHGIIITA